MNVRKITVLCLSLIYLSLSTACSNSSSKISSGQLKEEFVVPYDAAKSRYVLVVDAIAFSRKFTDNEKNLTKNDYALHNDVLDPLLISSLAGVENLIIVDKSFATISRQNRVRVPGSFKNARGPYLVRVAVTEINQEVDSKKGGIDASFSDMADPSNDDSALMLLAKFPLALTSFWFTTVTSLPSSYRDAEIRGVAGLDVQIIDGTTGRIVNSFPVQGTHVLKVRQIGNEYAGGFYSKRTLSSTSTQAVAAALNAAAKRVLEELSKSQ